MTKVSTSFVSIKSLKGHIILICFSLEFLVEKKNRFHYVCLILSICLTNFGFDTYQSKTAQNAKRIHTRVMIAFSATNIYS